MGEIIQYLNYTSGLLASLAGLFFFQYLKLPYRFALLYISTGTCFDIAMFTLFKLGMPNIIYYNYYLIIDLWLVCIPGIILVGKPPLALIILALFATFMDIYLIASSDNFVFMNWCLLTESVIVVLLYLIVILKYFKKETNPFSYPVIFLCFGVIIYYACCIPYFAFINYLIKSNQSVAYELYIINDFANIIKYLFIGLTFILNKSSIIQASNG